MNTTMMHFKKKVCIKINPTHNIFKWMFVYYKWYILIELMFLKELMLIKQVHQKSVWCCHYWYFLNYCFKFQVNVFNRCNDLLMIFIKLSDIALLNIKCSDYRCIISLINKNEAIHLWKTADLTKKSGTL